MSSTSNPLRAEQRSTLLEIARQSIASGQIHDRPLAVNPARYPPALREERATFVTLDINTRLRGCIGALEASQPLVVDVAKHAYAAAFEDPRFPPLPPSELDKLSIHISVLSPPEALPVTSEAELLQTLRPRVDGLILSLHQHRATFLPAVWESLPDPYVFLSQLKKKAELPIDFWSDEFEFFRYTTESFP